MRTELLIFVPLLAFVVGSVVVCLLADRRPGRMPAGMPAVARSGGRAVVRRSLGVRPRRARHRKGGARRV